MPFPTDFELLPLRGAGELHFKMSFAQVVSLLGEPEQPPATQWGSTAQRAGWAGGALAVHFNPEVEFIEFSRSRRVRPILGDLAPFDLSASTVIERMKVAGYQVDKSDPDLGHSFIYLEVQVAFWRHAMPEDENNRDGLYFDTVGFGRPNYYS